MAPAGASPPAGALIHLSPSLTQEGTPPIMTDQLIPDDLLTRAKVIDGLRQLADYLADHPDVPVTRYGWDLNIYADSDDGDAAATAEVDRIAAILGVTPADDTTRGGHYIATRCFGLISYRAVHVPERRMAEHHALMSYRDCVTLAPGEVTT
jgi:hypothetical protein